MMMMNGCSAVGAYLRFNRSSDEAFSFDADEVVMALVASAAILRLDEF